MAVVWYAPSPRQKKTNDKALFFEVGWFLVYPRHRHERHFRANCILLNGGQDQEGKKRTGRGGIKRRRGERRDIVSSPPPPVADSGFLKGEGETNNTFPIGKKKGIGWRPQKNTGALSSRRAARTVGIFFSFERRIKNRGESLFSAGGFASPTRYLVLSFNATSFLFEEEKPWLQKLLRGMWEVRVYASFTKKTVGDRERVF